MTVPVRREKQQTTSLSDIFNRFAKDSIQRFPSLKGRLLVYDHNERATYGRDELKLKKVGYTAKELDAFLRKNTAPANVETSADWSTVSFILYGERISVKEWNNVSAKTEKDILFLLDHELAHIVIKDPPLVEKNRQYKNTIKEAIADAYALMRHYQRYGAQSEHRNTIVDPWARAAALILNKDKEHFTMFMLDEIIRQKDTLDFASLTPRQTAELAKQFAVDYTLSSSAVNKAVGKFSPVQQAHEASPRSDLWLRKLAEITLGEKKDSPTFRIGLKALQGYLDGRKDMEGQSVKAIGKYWDDIREKVKEMELRHYYTPPRTRSGVQKAVRPSY